MIHTFVPHCDTMRCFEVSKEEGDEEVAIYFDINAAELRSIAYTSRDPAAMKIFDDGNDFYLEVVKSAYPNDTPQEWKKKRKRWKQCVLGIFYGIGNQAIANMYNLSLDEADFIRHTLMDKLGIIRKDIEDSVAFCKKNGEIKTIMGDRMFAPFWRAATVGYNSKIQGFSAVALADAFYNDVICLNAIGCPTNIKIVVHDSNTIVTKIKNLFTAIIGIEKYYKGYFLKSYKLRYKYDLILHINLRDAIEFSFNTETMEVELNSTGDGCEWLYNCIKKYYPIEVIEESVETPPEDVGWDVFCDSVLNWQWKSHRYYCDMDWHLPSKYHYKFKLLATYDELSKEVKRVEDFGVYFKDRDMKSHLPHTWSINE